MPSHINTMKRHENAESSDPDSGLLKEVESHYITPRKDVDMISALAEAEFLKIHEQNKKEAEKKAYVNKQYGEEIFLLFLLEECRLYLSFIRIIEQNMDKFIEQQTQSDRVKYDESIKMLQTRFQDIYQTQVKSAPLNQTKEQLFTKTSSHLEDVRAKLAEVSQKMEKEWGASTWEEGLKVHAKEAIAAIRAIDPLEGIDLPADKIDIAKLKFEEMYTDLEERLAKRFSFSDIRKVVDASHRSQAELFAPKKPASIVFGADAPMAPAPTLAKIYAPSNRQVKTQYEVDTEVLLAANGRNTYKAIFDDVEQPKSFTRMGVELAKRELAVIKSYINKINHHMDDSLIRENLLRLESKIIHMVKEMKLDARDNMPKPGNHST
ncbi:MAG: hypothetical protein P4M14_00410 [Gammaproteobacteria bacterium]|nr:hypothetical protein [Gammaproteobacteria bacterium]